MRRAPTCKCPDCEATAILRLSYVDSPHAQRAIRRLLAEYRKAMRLLVHVDKGLFLFDKIRRIVERREKEARG